MLTRLTFAACLALLLNACSDGGSSNNSPPPMMDPPPANTTDISVDLSGDQVAVANSLNVSGSADADLTLNNDDNTLSGTVTVSNLTANSVTLRSGFAGDTGAALVMFNDDGGGQWSVPPNTVLTDADLEALENGALYVHVTTTDMPEGALRGQILMGATEVVRVALNATQNVPVFDTDARGLGFLTIDRERRFLVAHVNTEGVDDAVFGHIHQALAGDTDDIVVDLMQDSEDPGHWFTENPAVEGTELDDAAIDDVLAALDNAELYFNIQTSANNFAGTIRGQIIPEGIGVIFTPLTGAETGVTTTASAVAAMTLNPDTGAADIFVNTAELDDAISVTLNQAPAGESGPVVVDFELANAANPTRWVAGEGVTFSDEQLGILGDDGFHYVVTTPAFPDGEVRGQLIAPSSLMLPDAPGGNENATFTFIQNNVFSPICVECHVGASPSGGLNLEEGQAYGNIVNVASGQVPDLLRIEAGNPDDSYLVRKLEGTNSVGGRMPLGGPFLDQETIDTIRQWVTDGAQNN